MSEFNKTEFTRTIDAGVEHLISLPAFQEAVEVGGINVVAAHMVQRHVEDLYNETAV